MLKSAIEPFYQSLFNYVVKKDGYSKLVSLYTGFLLFVIFFTFVLGTVVTIINLLFDDILTHSNSNKGVNFLIVASLGLLNHLFLFHVLKLQKESSLDDHLFKIEPRQYKRNLRIILSAIVSFFVVMTIYITVKFIEESGN